MRLRRDGKRPEVFDGVQLACFTARSCLDASDLDASENGSGSRPSGTATGKPAGAAAVRTPIGWTTKAPLDAMPDPAAEQTLELFLASDGRVFVQMRLLVSPGLAARSTHRVAELASREDLDRFLSAHRPEEAFCVGTNDAAGTDRRTDAILSNLRADFARMTAPLQRDRFGETLT
jgi:hypothetical protein